MSRLFVTVYVGLLFGTVPASLDAYAAVQGVVRDGLAITNEQTQLAMSVVILAAGLGQVLFGPLSDAYGRRPVIVAGLGLFVGGSAICAFATSIEVLLCGRLLQGLGAAAGQTVGRAVLRDLYAGRDLAHMTSGATALMAVVVVVSPAIGYSISLAASWRLTFAAMLAYGLALLLASRFLYRETHLAPDKASLRPATLWRSTAAVFAHPQSRLFMLSMTVCGFAMFSYVVSAQHVYQSAFGVTGLKFSLLYSLIGFGVILGQLINRTLIHRIGTAAAIVAALAFLNAALLVGIAFAAAGLFNEYGYAAVVFCFALGFMVNISNSAAMVQDPHGSIAGFAASLMGAIPFALGSTIGTALAWHNAGDPLRTMAGMLVVCLVALAMSSNWLWFSRHRHAAESA